MGAVRNRWPAEDVLIRRTKHVSRVEHAGIGIGMDGQLTAGFDAPVDWVEGWDYMVKTNDLINANTGVFDPRLNPVNRRVKTCRELSVHSEESSQCTIGRVVEGRTINARFLGMDGQLTAGFDAPVDWVEGWDYMVKTNDLILP
jgi:hypothetical protein